MAQPKCECYVRISQDTKDQYQIVYCPLHKAAPKMYEALKTAILCVENRERRGSISGINWERLIFDLKDVLKQAEDK